MRREVTDRLANRVRGLAEIEIEYPLRVGNHCWAASGQVRRSCARPFALQITMSRAGDAEKRHKLTLALTTATGCNSHRHGHLRAQSRMGPIGRRPMHGTIDLAAE